MQVTETLKQAVHKVLIDMAINCELEGDINALDIDTVFEKAQTKIKEDELAIARHEAEGLGNFLLEEYLFDVRTKLIRLAQAGKGHEMVDHHFTPIEIYEHTFTINDLLSEIKIK
jgi:hypothetical protein